MVPIDDRRSISCVDEVPRRKIVMNDLRSLRRFDECAPHRTGWRDELGGGIVECTQKHASFHQVR